MTVYVDDMAARMGRMIMFHMLSDADEDLHAMADRIGVARRWFQAPPRHDSHYDISQGKRDLAIAAGAQVITWRMASCMTLRRRVTGSLGAPAEAEAWVKEFRAGGGRRGGYPAR